MKIYTKRGDSGLTDLYDGSRVTKTDEIFDALGTLDELSSHIGMLIYLDLQYNPSGAFLRDIQQDLLDIGSIIATPNPKENQVLPSINAGHIEKLESQIDEMDTKLQPLTVFIKVGGSSQIESQAHICRAVCRRAERCILKCVNDGDFINQYMNRLSDYFFTLARYMA